jgi:hypothetical protein
MFKQKLAYFSIYYAVIPLVMALMLFGIVYNFYLPVQKVEGAHFEMSLPEESSKASFCLTDDTSLTILGTEFFHIVQSDTIINSKYDGSSSELSLEQATGCWEIIRSSPMKIRFIQPEGRDIEFVNHEVNDEKEIKVCMYIVTIFLLMTSLILMVLGFSTLFDKNE